MAFVIFRRCTKGINRPIVALLFASVLLCVSVGLVTGCSSRSAATASATSSGGGAGAYAGSNVVLPAVEAYAADRFADSIGVNTHMAYTNTPYAGQWPQVLAALETLGVRHVRDGYYPWPAGTWIYARHRQLAAAGIGCNFVLSIRLGAAVPAMQTFAALAGDVESLEDPNECDAAGGKNCGGAHHWVADLQGFLPIAAAAGEALGVPVYGPSFTRANSYRAIGDIAADMTENNLHIYFGGRNPESAGWGPEDTEGHGYGSFAWWLDHAAIDAPGLPSVVTESGYLANATVTPYTLPQEVEANYVPRTALMAFKSGITRTYLYELLDEVSSPGYGLLHADLTPKAGYTALRNLIALTEDRGAAFTPAALAYKITGGDADLQQLLLGKRDGTYLLILWLGKSGYDPATMAMTPVTPESITLRLTGYEYTRTLYQFDSSGAMQSQTLTPTQDQALTVSDAVSIVAIGNPNY